MPVNRILMVCLACLALVACKKEKQADVTVVGDKIDPLAMESELRILALNGRIESGKNNPDIDWVSPFEDATGCKVKATMVESMELLDASIGNADFDIVITSDMALPLEKLTPLDATRLRSFKDLDKRFFVPQSRSRKFSLPFQWQLIKPVSPETEFLTQVESTHLMANAKNINCATKPRRTRPQQIFRPPDRQRGILDNEHQAEGSNQLQQLRRVIDAPQDQKLCDDANHSHHQSRSQHAAPKAQRAT